MAEGTRLLSGRCSKGSRGFESRPLRNGSAQRAEPREEGGRCERLSPRPQGEAEGDESRPRWRRGLGNGGTARIPRPLAAYALPMR